MEQNKKLCPECHLDLVICSICKREHDSENCEVIDGKVVCRWCKNKLNKHETIT